MYATTDPTGGLTSSGPPPHAGKSCGLDYGDDGAGDVRCGRIMPHPQNGRATNAVAEPESGMRFAVGGMVKSWTGFNHGAIECGMLAAAEVNAVLQPQA